MELRIQNIVNDMACFWEKGSRHPTFETKIGQVLYNITCDVITCSCNGSRSGYAGCQTCCCTLKEMGSNYVGKIIGLINFPAILKEYQ